MPRRRYRGYNPLYIYTQQYIQTTLEDAIRENEEKLREWEMRMRLRGGEYVTRTTEAGRMLEVEIRPAFHHRRDYTRATRKKRTREEMQQLNNLQAQRKLVRLVHANFVEKDIFFTGGYSHDRQPASLEECKKDVSRFVARLAYHARKTGVKHIRYIYVIEVKVQQDGTPHFHVHMILGREAGANIKGVDRRDWVEDRWTGDDYANTKSLQWKRDGGFTGISKYFTKQFEELHRTGYPHLRRWGQSLGLKKWTEPPKETLNRFRKRRVASMLRTPATFRTEFEREFPGYRYLEDYPVDVRYSDVADGFYLYCRMYRKE